jgi:hypothetical protein
MDYDATLTARLSSLETLIITQHSDIGVPRSLPGQRDVPTQRARSESAFI